MLPHIIIISLMHKHAHMRLKYLWPTIQTRCVLNCKNKLHLLLSQSEATAFTQLFNAGFAYMACMVFAVFLHALSDVLFVLVHVLQRQKLLSSVCVVWCCAINVKESELVGSPGAERHQQSSAGHTEWRTRATRSHLQSKGRARDTKLTELYTNHSLQCQVGD